MTDFGSVGWGFESLQGHKIKSATIVCGFFLLNLYHANPKKRHPKFI
jgi:hypothetical protein